MLMREDVAIVGAGPAGARAAYALARQGARVTIFDPSHPREKPCGGGVTGRALELVTDAIDPARLPHTGVRTARFAGASGDKAPAAPFAIEGSVVALDDEALVVVD